MSNCDANGFTWDCFASAAPRWLCEVGDFTFVASLYRLVCKSGKLNSDDPLSSTELATEPRPS